VAAALENALGIGADLIEGDDGVFEVAVDGDVVFSKKERGGFISTPEIVEMVTGLSPPHSH
jgi:selT/selW/selH-like putative selenoprotein